MNRVNVALILTLALVGVAEAQKRTKYTVTVTIAGTGTGTVTSSPAGISCPGICSFQFNSGTDVVLTAAPTNGSTFSGWSGDCAGTGNCSLPLLASAKSVTASFTAGGGGGGGGGNPPTITEVYFDLLDGPTGSLTVVGTNFDVSTVAKLGTTTLALTGTTATAYTAALPSMLANADYLLTMTNSAGSATWNLTFPAEGPQGPEGPQGLPGLQGPEGPPGADGIGIANAWDARGSVWLYPDGTTNSNSLVGTNNIGIGSLSLLDNSTGSGNVSLGHAAMQYNSAGSNNVAVGNGALYFSPGSANTAIGVRAGTFLSNGSGNTYIASEGAQEESFTLRIGSRYGFDEIPPTQRAFINGIRGVSPDGLLHQVVINELGQLGSREIENFPLRVDGANRNTAAGVGALINGEGLDNTAFGFEALKNTVNQYPSGEGLGNTAIGSWALTSNLSGYNNNAVGQQSLKLLESGWGNDAFGAASITALITGSANTGIGIGTLSSLQEGSNNIALGAGSGGNLVTGSGNLYISNAGASEDLSTIRIGDAHQKTFIAGVKDVSLSGSIQQVVIDESGQLGTTTLANTAGCSVEQQSNYAVFTCEDGSSATLASAGTVVIWPEGGIGSSPPVTYPTGEVVLMDANNTVLGKITTVHPDYYGFRVDVDFGGTIGVSPTEFAAVNQPDTSTIFFTGWFGYVWYLDENCSGHPFLDLNAGSFFDGENFWVADRSMQGAQILFKSLKYIGPGNPAPCFTGETVAFAVPAREFVPPAEWTNAVYPASPSQLP